MTKKSAGFGQIFSVLVLAILLGVSVFVIGQKTNFSNRAAGTSTINQRVFFLVFDPYLPKRQMTLSKYFEPIGTPPGKVFALAAADFRDYSRGELNYTLVKTQTVNDFPVKRGGFKHTEDTFFECEANPGSHSYCEADADWDLIVKTYDFCGMVNRQEIDEIWLDAPPRAGFFESALVGPQGFPFNGPTLNNGCQHTIPWMAMQYARTWDGGHGFGHRMEATMTHRFGRWQGNVTDPNDWEKFGMTRFESPRFSYAGCGSIHYSPNARSNNDAYNYAVKDPYPSICDDFKNYPNLSDPNKVKQNITCDSWGCTETGYYRFWFNHLPHNPGTNSQGHLNNWWFYYADPTRSDSPPPTTVNLLQNPSFDQDTNSDLLPDLWKGVGLDGTDRLDKITKYDGPYSFKFSPFARNPAESLSQTIAQKGDVNQALTFTLWNKATSSASGSTGISVKVAYVDGTFGGRTLPLPKTTRDWTKQSVTFVTQKPYQKIGVKIQNTDRGATNWFDAASLAVTPNSSTAGIKTTDQIDTMPF